MFLGNISFNLFQRMWGESWGFKRYKERFFLCSMQNEEDERFKAPVLKNSAFLMKTTSIVIQQPQPVSLKFITDVNVRFSSVNLFHVIYIYSKIANRFAFDEDDWRELQSMGSSSSLWIGVDLNLSIMMSLFLTGKFRFSLNLLVLIYFWS